MRTRRSWTTARVAAAVVVVVATLAVTPSAASAAAPGNDNWANAYDNELAGAYDDLYWEIQSLPGDYTIAENLAAVEDELSAFPEAYAKWEGMATQLTTALKGSRLGRLTCS